jgi:hypothetical protein
MPKPKEGHKRKKRRSPIKSKWLMPLIKERIAEQPTMSNKEYTYLLCLHACEDFLTIMILQTIKKLCRFKIFGNPTENVHYTTAMMRVMTIRGHKVEAIIKTASNVMSHDNVGKNCG